jgi:hypothetical protein
MQLCACLTQKSNLLRAAGLALSLATLPTLAGAPSVLDHVPSDAQAVVVVPHFGELIADVNAMNAMMGDQGEPGILMVSALIRGMPGINLDGSAAAVLEMVEGQEEPEMVLLVPVSDFDAFAEGHGVEDGIHKMMLGDAPSYFRDAGNGFIVFGQSAEDVEGFDASAGQMDKHASLLGSSGQEIASSNDIMLYVNIASFEDEIAMGMEEMEAQGDMVEMMGGAEAAAGFDMMLSAVQTMVNDSASFSAGMSVDQETGMSFDVGMQFKEGSTSASYLQNKGNAGKYFSNVPSMEYFYASAFDMSGEGIQRFMQGYMDMVEQMDMTGMMKEFDIASMVEGMKGGIQVMGAPDNIMGGLMNNSLYYMEVAQPKEFIGSMQTMFKSVTEGMEQMKEMGVGVELSLDEKPTTINGVDAYGFSVGVDMTQMGDMGGAMGGMNPGMIMQMIYGGEGPSGYMAEAGDGVLMTMSQNAGFLAKAAAAADGEKTMGANAAIAKTASMLPSNRIVETYIAVDHIINTAGPMMMMMGVLPEFEPMNGLPPLGMGLSADGGGLLFRTVLPNQTVHSVMEMIPEEMWDEMGDGAMDF